MAWTYDPSQFEERSYQLIPKGDHRVRIAEVTPKLSKNGNEYYELTLDVSGYNSKLWFNLVFMPSNPQQTNQRIGELLKCFNITDTNLDNYAGWVGKVGAVKVVHEKQDGYEERAVAKYLIFPEKAANLPAWKEPGGNTNSNNSFEPVQPVDNVEVPW